jgi:hypothetical protein
MREQAAAGGLQERPSLFEKRKAARRKPGASCLDKGKGGVVERHQVIY